MTLISYLTAIFRGLELLIKMFKILLKFYRDMKHRNELSTMLYNAI